MENEVKKIYVHDRWDELTDNYKATMLRIYFLKVGVEPINDIYGFREYVNENIEDFINELNSSINV